MLELYNLCLDFLSFLLVNKTSQIGFLSDECSPCNSYDLTGMLVGELEYRCYVIYLCLTSCNFKNIL